jgi:ketopantoate hydroxymethyltransferase
LSAQGQKAAKRLSADIAGRKGKTPAVRLTADIRYMADRGLPVMGHVGLRPQSVVADGGSRAKGRDNLERTQILAVAAYAADVRTRRFPGPAEIYFAKAV